MERADICLAKLGLAKSRTHAKTIIEEKRAFYNGKVIEKVSMQVDPDFVTIKSTKSDEYVGRGAKKLLSAIESFEIDVSGKFCMDIGASTGGFTQILLEKGAIKVFAVDVGVNQLSEKISKDTRVVNLENTNFRYLEFSKIEKILDFICIDVSFISLKHIFSNLKEFSDEKTEIVALIKPQFECEKSMLNKKGIVKNPKYWKEVLINVTEYATENGFKIKEIIESPIFGGDGNKEFLAYIRKEN